MDDNKKREDVNGLLFLCIVLTLFITGVLIYASQPKYVTSVQCPIYLGGKGNPSSMAERRDLVINKKLVWRYCDTEAKRFQMETATITTEKTGFKTQNYDLQETLFWRCRRKDEKENLLECFEEKNAENLVIMSTSYLIQNGLYLESKKTEIGRSAIVSMGNLETDRPNLALLEKRINKLYIRIIGTNQRGILLNDDPKSAFFRNAKTIQDLDRMEDVFNTN